ncbi:MAG TPA: hypothetical protein ENH65_10815, partial [Candidatus Aminicenantes bacterium]|nr:hypothetical protein [Candidatus Aminicenantes bacterium]
MMKTILFGSGASVDESANGKVPLTNGLFKALRESKKSWKNLPSKWVQEFEKVQEFENNRFEQAMEKLLDEQLDSYQSGKDRWKVDFSQIAATPYIRRWRDLQWDIAEYFYLEHKLKKDSLYMRLLEKIKPHFLEFKLATLNYDILLFQALERVKLLGADVSLALPIPICLPHGSSLLYCSTPNLKRTDNAYALYPGTQIAGDPLNIDEDINRVVIKAFTSAAEFHERKEDLFPPIMCYIEPNKRIKIGNKFIQAEQQKWYDWVMSSEAIVIIGVDVNEKDKHIWEPLGKT